MKTFSTASALSMLIVVFLSIFLTNDLKSQIVSAPAGGLWSSPSTWIGGIVPVAANDVVISSTVSANNNSCRNLTVQSGGILTNSSATSYSLTVFGNLSNAGTIADNIYSLYITLHGNLLNTGTLSNNTLTFTGILSQQISSIPVITIANFDKIPNSGKVIATSNLSFSGTTITFNSDTLEFTTGNSISMNGGSFNTAFLYKASLPALQLANSNGTYLFSTTIDSPQTELTGTLLIFGNNSFMKNSVVNMGTLQNRSTSAYTLYIQGNFTNNGTVENNVYSFNLSITGNLTNNGIWTNQTTTLNGAGNQSISASQPFSGAELTRVAAQGMVIATSNLVFNNTAINLNNDTLRFTTGNSISMNGGFIYLGVLYKTSLPALQMSGSNGSYIYLITVDSPQTELSGTVLILGNSVIMKNNVVNFGLLQNRSSSSYILTIQGNFTNNGTVSNNVYNFILNISGNLTNNGIWSNQTTTLNGAGNQLISTSQPFSGNELTRNAAPGRVIAINNLNFNNTIINLNSDTLEFTTGSGITLTGGYFTSATLLKTALPSLKITSGNGTYLTGITIDSPQTELFGIVLISGNSNNFKTHLINNGTLRNRSTSNYTLTVDGQLANNGSIQNNVYDLSLSISGNVINNGVWRNKTTTLTGSSLHTFNFTESFEGENLVNSNASGGINAISDLTFDGTNIDLNGCSVTIPTNGYLSILNGSMLDALINGTDIHFKSLGAYCQNINFNANVTLHGVFQAGSGITFTGNVINEGFLRNRSVSNYDILVQGDIHNNGTIENYVYNFTITVLGNIYNNGVWSNQITILDGTSNQNIVIINDSPIQSQVRLDANFTGSSFTWWGPTGSLIGNPNFTGANTQLLRFNNNPVSNADAGQYYCVNNTSASSRIIQISAQSTPIRILQLNVLLEGPYIGSGLMSAALSGGGVPIWNSNTTDLITVSLHAQGNFSNIVFTDPEIILATNGSASIAIPAALNGNYYLAIKHRNSIHTVSALPVSFANTVVNYNFDLNTKAFGNNLSLMSDGRYVVFGGDVNQDEIVDSSDMIAVDNESASFTTGYYQTDANGDGLTDSGDMIIVDNNSSSFVTAVLP